MKIAISGKGGVGKSTVAGIFAHLAARQGQAVLAVDSDTDANLAFALGMPEEERRRIVPIAQRTELIEERTGARLGQFGQIFKLNPTISDVADRFGYEFKGIHLLVLGGIEAGGSGCACPENVFVRSLLTHVILERDEHVIVDMEAGIEHLGRATARGVDVMIVVVEPTPQSIATARSIAKLTRQIGLEEVRYIVNKVASDSELDYAVSLLESDKIVGSIPYAKSVVEADRSGIPLIDNLEGRLLAAFEAAFRNVSTPLKETKGSQHGI
jgi:CO dehydrogenase maturation factor